MPRTLQLTNTYNISILPMNVLNLSIKLKAINGTFGEIQVGDPGHEGTRKLVQAMKEADAENKNAAKGP